MIFKKGTEVEVLEKGKEPLGSWRPARILSGNGHTYVVNYDSFPLGTAGLMTQVPRKALRPRPLFEVKSWACADFVEVFDDGSWKYAEVLRTLGLKMVVARLLGSSKEIVAHFFHLRMPQTWKDNHWIPLKKESVKCEKADVDSQSKRWNLSSQIPMLSVEQKKCERVDRFAERNGDSVDQWYQKSLGRLKNQPRECRPPVHSRAGAFGVKKQIKKKGRCYRLPEHNLTNQLFEKVDAVDSPQNFYGEKHMNAAFYHESAGFGQIGIYCQNPIANSGPNLEVSLDLSDCATTTSSVGSCSVVNGLCRSVHHKISQRQELCGHIDDAESFCGSPTEPSHFREDEMTEAIHCLELDAYRSTLRSLYASGTLSWDQESLLTNLRLALNISNDEHLYEIKDLMSTRS